MIEKHRMWFLAAWIFVTMNPALAADSMPIEIDAKAYKTPTKILSADKIPTFADDYDFDGMKLAISRQLVRLEKKNLTGTIQLGTKIYPLSKVKTSLHTFNSLIDRFLQCKASGPVNRCYNDFNTSMRARFNVYIPALVEGDPRYGEEQWAFFTGYQTFPVDGLDHWAPDHPYAVYRNPNSADLNKSRIEIDLYGALAGKNLEITWTKSLFDIYMLHIEGSGHVVQRNSDGTTSRYYLNYDGTNGQRFGWISTYMQSKGYINNGSLAAQRKYMSAHPEKAAEIYSQCPSYVWMRTSSEPPLGSDSVSVTDRRSIAQDSSLYAFKGLITYIESTRPAEDGNYDLTLEDNSQINFMPFSRFFLDQDTGGAIKGKGRADIYFGEDTYALFASEHEQQLGKIYYFMEK